LEDKTKGTFHAAFFEEEPMPGPVTSVKDTRIVRLKSKMHHTTGSHALDGAREHLSELAKKILIPENNVISEKAIPWDGELGIVLFASNWTLVGGKPELTSLLESIA
jgi:hypothetical protein